MSSSRLLIEKGDFDIYKTIQGIWGFYCLEITSFLANSIRKRWAWSRERCQLVYVKLDSVRVEWIIRKKDNGAKIALIESLMRISVRRCKTLVGLRDVWNNLITNREGRTHILTAQVGTDEENRIRRKESFN